MVGDMRIAVIGAGPVGMAFALSATHWLPRASVSLFDARSLDSDLHSDPRALALSWGSIQLLEGLGLGPALEVTEASAEINEVRVSSSGPALADLLGLARSASEVRIRAEEEGVARLGSVVRYGALSQSLQEAWLSAASAQAQRLFSRFQIEVRGTKLIDQGIELDADICEVFDLAVIAEGGLFDSHTGPAQKAGMRHEYGQLAYVGEACLVGYPDGVAFERFTHQGPLALLPLPSLPQDPEGHQRVSVVWCVSERGNALDSLCSDQLRTLLQAVLPEGAGRVVSLSNLKRFVLGAKASWRPQALMLPSMFGFRSETDRQVRIGNAAQTLHPVAGQGLNLGLRDAYILAQSLRGAPTLRQSIRRFERDRAQDRGTVLMATDLLARGFVWDGLGPASIRAAALDLISTGNKLQRMLAHTMMFGGGR